MLQNGSVCPAPTWNLSAKQFCQSDTRLRYSEVKMVIFCHLRGRERNRVGFIPSQFVRALSWSVILSPHFAVLASSSNFLLCSFSSANNTVAFCLWNISIRHLLWLQPLTLWPHVRCVTRAIQQPLWRTPRPANSIWSYLPSSHSAESLSVSGGVSKDHYHILSMSSFMAPV